MPNSSKRKGDVFEREVVHAAQDMGIAAEKVPLSGAVKGGSFEGDINMPVRGIDRKLECKRRKSGFKTPARWLAGNYALVVRDDHCEPFVFMRLTDFLALAK